jgi:hypothetical protein
MKFMRRTVEYEELKISLEELKADPVENELTNKKGYTSV